MHSIIKIALLSLFIFVDSSPVDFQMELDDEDFVERPIKLGGIEISALGIGCWSWGDSTTWDYDPSQDDELYKGFAKAVDSGVNFFDTAEMYGFGKSEELINKFVKKYKESHPNASIALATKFMPLPWRLTQDSLHSALNGSLDRLGVQSVDLYQIHGISLSFRSVETWAEALADAYEQGLIKTIGVSNYNADQVRRTQTVLRKRGLQLSTNQIEFNLLRNNALFNGMVDTCNELGVKLIAYSPLAMGRLTGKYSAKNPPPSGRKFGSSASFEEIEAAVEVLREIGASRGKTPAQVALNWVMCKGAIPLAGLRNISYCGNMLGIRNEKQATENLGSLGWRLNKEEIARLDAVSRAGPAWDWWQES